MYSNMNKITWKYKKTQDKKQVYGLAISQKHQRLQKGTRLGLTPPTEEIGKWKVKHRLILNIC